MLIVRVADCSRIKVTIKDYCLCKGDKHGTTKIYVGRIRASFIKDILQK